MPSKFKVVTQGYDTIYVKSKAVTQGFQVHSALPSGQFIFLELLFIGVVSTHSQFCELEKHSSVMS